MRVQEGVQALSDSAAYLLLLGQPCILAAPISSKAGSGGLGLILDSDY